MDQAPYGQRGPAAEILGFIHRHGPQDIKALEARLGVSANAVREQVQHLLGAGLITMGKVRRSAGRPAHVYSLSEKAQRLFPQPYDVLLKLLLEQIVKEEGAPRAQQLLNAVGEQLADDMTGEVRSADLREQLDKVVTALDRRGMPIALHEQEDVVALQEWSCPYSSVARDHPGICEMEQHMLQRMLGAEVTVVERMVDGHANCRFLIQSGERNAVS